MSAVHSKERLEVKHVLNVPIHDAFNAWRDPGCVEEWWGPEGYQTKVEVLDMRPGGAFLFQMTAPSGASCPMSGTYIRVDDPNVLEFEVHQHCVADIPPEVKEPTRSSHVSVTFSSLGDKTEVTLVQTGLATDYQMLAEVGWTNCFERQERLTISIR